MKNVFKLIKHQKFINTAQFFHFCEKSQGEFTSFGFKNVKKEERQNMVNSVFHSVAGKYFSLI